MNVSGKTKITGIFGYPIEHSLSPLMHNRAFDVLGLDMLYLAFQVLPQNLADAINALKALQIVGVNITVPHKERVIPLLDELDKEASFIGAVNTVVNSAGKLKGYNTDGKGFMNALSEENIPAREKEIFIIGAGGAARAISYYLSEKASKLTLYDIDQAKSENLVNDLKKIRHNVFLKNDLKNIGSPGIIINATPVGLKQEDPLPLDPVYITPDTIVIDLIYKKTNFLKEADKKKAKALDGSGMLLWQGVLAFELWTGKKPPVDEMRSVLLSAINMKERA
jgi:shikimate dehydrogenase